MESDQIIFHYTILTFYLIAPTTFISLRFLQAPYGKHNRPGWGPTMHPSLAWFLMESPTLWLTLLIFPFGRHFTNPKASILISPFLFHYFHRVIIYPLRLKTTAHDRKTDVKNTTNGFPMIVALMAFGFNLLNTYLQARWVSHYKDYEADDGLWFWLRFFSGLVVFGVGMVINVWSDKVLVGLKRQGGGYKVPRGGWFDLVSCPNYFGEIVEWLGWSVMTCSWVGFGFFLNTCANLVPRARANHQWYLEKFGEDYPKCRKAVIPHLC
ncbi:Steroid_dh domain-containing protein [Cephalotus follicularis]|uniref:Steroid 5-alpha-reductase DET2 n=1 Tax=Cephalotus follicularis TaxID=3775 RepID=A0A1Q3BKU6_CEPFO|nr:Steroid_dh domain-containing protein [Cephalotus follicularis]